MLLDNGSSLPMPAQALAELVPQMVTSYYYPDHLGMELERSFALYGEIYMRNNWVRACIDKRANAVAQLPVQVWDIDGDTPVLDTKSQYARLMAQPCDYLDNHTFWLWVSTTLDLYGETYLAITRQDPEDPTSAPINLMPMHPSRVAIKRDPKTARYTYSFLAGVYGYGEGLVEFPQEDIVPFRLIHPHKLERGLSKLESLKSTIFAEDASRNATSAMWRNAGRPNVILQHPDAISPAALKRLQQQFDQAHAGSSNTGKTLVIEEGMKVSSFQLSAQDMEWVSSRQLNREEICGLLDCPPPMVGIHDHSTYSNVTELLRGFYRDTINPYVRFIQSVMNRYVGDWWARKNSMRFAVDEMIRGDYEKLAEVARALVATGVMTPNEAREIMGLNRLDDDKANQLSNLADRLYANSAMQPLGAPAEQIRLMGQITGQTPDGTQLTTPIASPSGGEPQSVPPLPQGNSESSPKHLRAVKRALGRREDIKAFAMQLAEKHPDDLDDILAAVKLAIESKGNTP